MKEQHPYTLVEYNPQTKSWTRGTIEADKSELQAVIEVVDNHTTIIETAMARQNLLMGVNIVLLCMVLLFMSISMLLKMYRR